MADEAKSPSVISLENRDHSRNGVWQNSRKSEYLARKLGMRLKNVKNDPTWINRTIKTVRNWQRLHCSAASIYELARSLDYNIDNIFAWIYSNVDFCPIWGRTKWYWNAHWPNWKFVWSIKLNGFPFAGMWRCCWYGYSAEYAFGNIQLLASDIENFLGTDDSTVATSTEDLLKAAYIPYDATYVDGVLQSVSIAHVWVRATIDTAQYVFDPTYKAFSYTTGIDLSSIIDYDASALTAAAQDGPQLLRILYRIWTLPILLTTHYYVLTC